MGDVVGKAIRTNGPPDRIFCSDMFDLPTWLGFACRNRQTVSPTWLSEVPLVTYFHENQWAYPSAPKARVDHHYGFTNLLTAALSDACWFNSQFNLRSFLEHSSSFLSRMPDHEDSIDIEQIERSSRVIAPGFVPPKISDAKRFKKSTIRLGWVGRMEHDKRPDRFLKLLDRLAEMGRRFELILLGQRGRKTESIDQIRRRYADQILWDGFAPSRDHYETLLGQIDVVVSTADHEFFGIALCEAIWAGAIPVTPNDLSYTDYVPQSLRYHSIDHAAEIIARVSTCDSPDTITHNCRDNIRPFRIDQIVDVIDLELERLRPA